MSSHNFYRLLQQLLVEHPGNRVLDAQIRSLDLVGEPTPMADAARYAWRKDVLVTAGLRDALHLLKAA